MPKSRIVQIINKYTYYLYAPTLSFQFFGIHPNILPYLISVELIRGFFQYYFVNFIALKCGQLNIKVYA